MNAITRAVGQTADINRPAFSLLLTGDRLRVALLVAVVLLSAFGVVYMKDLHRRLFIEHQQMQRMHVQLHTNWEKLLLEESTWSTQARVQQVAQQDLNMHVPTTRHLVTLK